jgi:UDP-N-acetylglucosamine--N-acetylmuramyl-(pentapeptide) pyrophosphoryl-undecaprenol N-acetylglucosamine transferase
MALVEQGAAVLVKDVEASTQLVNRVVELVKNIEEQEKLSERIAVMAKPDALSEIVNVIETTL